MISVFISPDGAFIEKDYSYCAIAHKETLGKIGFVTVYSHCQRVSASLDQKVGKGEVIAYVGRTGKATRPVCFYQIKIGTDFVDPAPYLNKIVQ